MYYHIENRCLQKPIVHGMNTEYMTHSNKHIDLNGVHDILFSLLLHMNKCTKNIYYHDSSFSWSVNTKQKVAQNLKSAPSSQDDLVSFMCMLITQVRQVTL